MSIPLFHSFRLSSNLRTSLAVSSKPTVNPAGARLAAIRPGGQASLQCAGALLFAIGALCPMAAGQIAHFSGARSKIVDGAQSPGASRDGEVADSGAKLVHSDQAPAPANFGSVNIGTTSAPMTLTFTFDAAATLGSTAVLTQGSPNLDFADAGTGTCTAGTAYAANATCTVDATFTPTLAGTRSGAAVLYDNAGTLIATGVLLGAGSGPQVNFLPGTETTFGSSNWTTLRCCVVLDGAGDLYVYGDGEIFLLTPSGGGYIQSGLNFIDPYNYSNFPFEALALDGAGNLYIVYSQWGGILYEETRMATGAYTQSAALSIPISFGAALDPSGNLYVWEPTKYQVLKETPSDYGYTPSVIYSCLNPGGQICPTGIAVDASGNVFLTESFSASILEVTPSAGGYTVSFIGSGLASPGDAAVDGNGNLYVADTWNSRIVKETPSANGYIQSVVPTATGLDRPSAVAVDGRGNLYISDTYNARYLKEDFWDPPSLIFTTTNNSPQTVTVENVGNAPLVFPVPSAGTNPSISGNFTLDSSASTACPLVSAGSSAPGTLAVGATCTLTISTSTVGTFSGSLVLTDTNLNASAPAFTTQTIPLTSMIATQSTLTASAAQVYVGQPITLTATVTDTSGNAAPTGNVTFAGAGSPAPTVTLNGSGVATFTSSTLPAGSYSVTAIYPGDATHLGSNSTAATFAVSLYASQTTISVSASQVQANQPVTLTATVSGAAGSATPTGNVGFSGKYLPSVVFALNSSGVATWALSGTEGNFGVVATYSGDATHGPSASEPVYFNVGGGPPASVIPGDRTPTLSYGETEGECAQVLNAEHKGLAGVTVNFSGAGLAVNPAAGITDSYNGEACTAVTPLMAGSQMLLASVAGVAEPGQINLTVNPVPLTVIPHGEVSRVYGAANVNPVFIMKGLVNGDTLGGTILVTAQTAATTASPVGVYPFTTPTVSGTSAGNYVIKISGTETLGISHAVLRVWAKDFWIHYGDTPPAPTNYFFTGFVNGDTASVISGAPTLSDTVTSTTPPGVYKIVPEAGTLSAQNYKFEMMTGVFEVYRAPLLVTANNVTMTQGNPVPALTYTLSGFVNGDTASVVSGAPVLSTTATSSSPPGTYPITVSAGTLSAANYGAVINYNGGVVTVLP